MYVCLLHTLPLLIRLTSVHKHLYCRFVCFAVNDDGKVSRILKRNGDATDECIPTVHVLKMTAVCVTRQLAAH